MFVLRCWLPQDEALVLAAMHEGDVSVSLSAKAPNACRLEFYCRTLCHARRIREQLATVIAAKTRMRIASVPKCNWAEKWRRQFRTRRISPRIIVKPKWAEAPKDKGVIVIEIEPCLAFGTGEHETTQSCLKLIDQCERLVPGRSFLDVGCGTGILAIAAAKMGLSPVHAIDNDPQSVKSTRANAELNGVRGKVSCRRADIMSFKPGRTYALVAANLFAGVLERAAPRLCALLAPGLGSRLILAGILDRQFPAVRRAFSAFGLRPMALLRTSGWTSAAFGRSRRLV